MPNHPKEAELQPALVSWTWKPPKKENSAALLRKVLASSSLLGPPAIKVEANDHFDGGVSATARAVKRIPELAAFATEGNPMGAATSVRMIRASTDKGLPAETLLGLLDGVPRSFPFNTVALEFSWPPPEDLAGAITDMWWINGRMRSVVLQWRTMAPASAKKLPEPSPGLAALLEALGKPKSKSRLPLEGFRPSLPTVTAVVSRYRETLAERVSALAFPHLIDADGTGEAAGPMKPTLVEQFGPLGFDCRGGNGVFQLRRRMPTNHTVELHLDVGTWSHAFSGFLSVHLPGGRATLPLLVGPGVARAPIRGAEGWKRIVENLGVVVAELERTFVTDVVEAAGPAPEWFEAPGIGGL